VTLISQLPNCFSQEIIVLPIEERRPTACIVESGYGPNLTLRLDKSHALCENPQRPESPRGQDAEHQRRVVPFLGGFCCSAEFFSVDGFASCLFGMNCATAMTTLVTPIMMSIH